MDSKSSVAYHPGGTPCGPPTSDHAQRPARGPILTQSTSCSHMSPSLHHVRPHSTQRDGPSPPRLQLSRPLVVGTALWGRGGTSAPELGPETTWD